MTTTAVPSHSLGRGGRVLPFESHYPRLSSVWKDRMLCGGDRAVTLDWGSGRTSAEVRPGREGEEGRVPQKAGKGPSLGRGTGKRKGPGVGRSRCV